MIHGAKRLAGIPSHAHWIYATHYSAQVVTFRDIAISFAISAPTESPPPAPLPPPCPLCRRARRLPPLRRLVTHAKYPWTFHTQDARIQFLAGTHVRRLLSTLCAWTLYILLLLATTMNMTTAHTTTRGP